MTIKEIMQNLQTEEGTFREDDIKKLSDVSGKSHAELFKLFNAESEPEIPQVDNPSKMRTKEKVAFIAEHGREAFEKLFDK